jgi:hypothetical protein
MLDRIGGRRRWLRTDIAPALCAEGEDLVEDSSGSGRRRRELA